MRAVGQIDDGRGSLLEDHEPEVGGAVDQRALRCDQAAGAPVPLGRKHKTQSGPPSLSLSEVLHRPYMNPSVTCNASC